MKSKQIRFFAFNAVIAALYAALTFASAFFGLAYRGVQFRISEALNVLCLFTPAAIPGLTVGCFLANLPSDLGPIDWFLGTLATLIAVAGIYFTRNIKFKSFPFVSLLIPALANGVIVGVELTYITEIFPPDFINFMIQGSLVALGGRGIIIKNGTLLYYRLLKNPGILDLDKLK